MNWRTTPNKYMVCQTEKKEQRHSIHPNRKRDREKTQKMWQTSVFVVGCVWLTVKAINNNLATKYVRLCWARLPVFYACRNDSLPIKIRLYYTVTLFNIPFRQFNFRFSLMYLRAHFEYNFFGGAFSPTKCSYFTVVFNISS